MELNALSVIVGIGLCMGMLYGFYKVMGYIMNIGRYSMPKFLPRDDEVYWAMAMAYPNRMWSYKNNSHINIQNWDMCILQVDEEACTEDYHTSPRILDIVLVPKKWGGYWAIMVHRRLNNNRLACTLIGEFNSGKIQSIRHRTSNIIIS
jgi:hypothetical protein